ncbi:limonene-1,2-epoxide hydrolase family protein [Vitreimonas sp.]|uniref:limonene-1,2-epoxide hydrolase family protein n=1 Tax=Vitreimonas sp. TaxID=3069702 RepID=UPI002ED863E4
MSDNERIVRDFIDTWPSLDVEKIVSFFAEDGVYYNMPIAPIAGRAALRPFIAAFLKDWTKTNWDVLNIASAGDVVIAERVDHIHVGDKTVDLPCCGVFELENGKIKVWRDYFDLATYTKALA